ncbi:MAG: amidase [Burkholderiales bacterium]|nr:amidase [Burkholderiales bacterium]
MPTIQHLRQQFLLGADSASDVVARQLARAQDPTGEGVRVFLSLDTEHALAAAQASERRLREAEVRPLDGVTVTIKDLFDVAGQVTAAGSAVLRTRSPADADCPAVARLRDAGAILFGRTNMVEFAYSGVGINPHYGTPRNVWGRTADGGGRVPGGSTSGGGVAVADGMATAALGSDTGGSVRIPAALNGICGFKPTAVRVPVLGAVPLSVSLDSVGPLATSVDCCARLDAVLAGDAQPVSAPLPLRGRRLLLPRATTVWRDLDREVGDACNQAVGRLRAAGADVVEAALPELDDYFATASSGGLSAPEALDWHAANLALDGAGYDPRVWQRMQLGRAVTRSQYAATLAFRRFWIDRMNLALAGFDALVCPTVACIAPDIAPLLVSDDAFFKANARILRNTAWVNFMDGCALTIPCHAPGAPPVGVQLVGRHGADRALLALGLAVEAALDREVTPRAA